MEANGYLVRVIRTRFGDDDELVGAAEAAELLGIGRAALWERRRSYGESDFPEPIAELRCGPISVRSQIVEYAREHGLPRDSAQAAV